MTLRGRAVLQLGLAALALAGCVGSWLQSRSTVEVAPVADGQPPTTSITFYAPLLVLAVVLLTVAGVLLVLAVANLRRRDGAVPAERLEPAPAEAVHSDVESAGSTPALGE
jgi:hypothetical protein